MVSLQRVCNSARNVLQNISDIFILQERVFHHSLASTSIWTSTSPAPTCKVSTLGLRYIKIGLIFTIVWCQDFHKFWQATYVIQQVHLQPLCDHLTKFRDITITRVKKSV